MRIMKKITVTVLVLCLTMIFAVPSFAADDYKYQVGISGGSLGTVSGSTSLEMNSGDYWNPNDYTVNPKSDKYYVKGFHISGQEALVGATQITEDTVFVASYGIKEDMVSYTVYYQTTDGANLADPATYYGNVGDKPVVAYKHFDGYVPNTYNYLKTLSKNAAENDITFYYTEGEEEATRDDDDDTDDDNGGNTANANGNANANAGAGAGNAAAIGDNATPQAAPQDTIDLDDGDVPLADLNDDNDKGGSSAGWIAGLIAVLAAAAIAAGVIMRRRKREE